MGYYFKSNNTTVAQIPTVLFRQHFSANSVLAFSYSVAKVNYIRASQIDGLFLYPLQPPFYFHHPYKVTSSVFQCSFVLGAAILFQLYKNSTYQPLMRLPIPDLENMPQIYFNHYELKQETGSLMPALCLIHKGRKDSSLILIFACHSHLVYTAKGQVGHSLNAAAI